MAEAYQGNFHTLAIVLKEEAGRMLLEGINLQYADEIQTAEQLYHVAQVLLGQEQIQHVA